MQFIMSQLQESIFTTLHIKNNIYIYIYIYTNLIFIIHE